MRVYRLLLHAYPSSFRGEYGDEMSSVFAQRRRDASNLFLVLILWIETVFDVLFNAFRVHIDILGQDLRYTARTLARTPGFTITAIVVAALGIGATTAAFTMIDHVLLRPLPFADQDRLVKLYEDHSVSTFKDSDVSPGNYHDWKMMSTSFESMAVYRTLSINLIGQGDPQRVDGAAVSAEMFPQLGVQPEIGRFFTEEDDRENAPGTVILSYGLWKDHFGGDASILGRKVLMDDASYTVIGVMPKTFAFPTRSSLLWTATRFGPRDYEDRTDVYTYVVGKLKRGVSFERAYAEMRTIGSQIERAHPKELAHISVTLERFRDDMPEQAKLMLKVLLAASICVLLVACTNLANLLLARAMSRRKELSVRAAMGAGRERLIRQMLTESLVLAAIGGAFGVLIAIVSLPLLVKLVPVYLPIAEVPPVDLRVMLFAGFITCATGIGFGVVPALRVCRGADGLREGSRSGVGGRKEKMRSVLVIAEIAGSVVLLVSCGLLIRALWRIQATDPGFRSENVLTMRTALPLPKYEKLATREQFYRQVLSEAQRLPGVTGAAYTSFLPMVQRGGLWGVEVEGHPVPFTERQLASLRFISPQYFSVMGIPLRAGRAFEDSDARETQFVAVVSDSLVRRYWPNENPLGRHFNFGNYDRVVVGVVGDVKVRGLERTSEPQVYLPYTQHDRVSPFYSPKDLAIHASGNVAALAPALRRIIHQVDPELPVSSVRMMSEIVESETASRRVQLGALGAFAGIAFLLAAIGIHGVLSFAVSNRTQEIGVRIALGARQGDILGMVMGDGVALAIIGVIAGVIVAYLAGQGMRALLAGVQPGDIGSFAAAVALCLIMTIVGSLLPALKAVRVDPTVAIRAE